FASIRPVASTATGQVLGFSATTGALAKTITFPVQTLAINRIEGLAIDPTGGNLFIAVNQTNSSRGLYTATTPGSSSAASLFIGSANIDQPFDLVFGPDRAGGDANANPDLYVTIQADVGAAGTVEDSIAVFANSGGTFINNLTGVNSVERPRG